MQDKLEKPWKFYLSQNKFLKIWENYIRMLHGGRWGGCLGGNWEMAGAREHEWRLGKPAEKLAGAMDGL
jgi:hypothetical protein